MKKIMAMVLCTLMMLTSFGTVSAAAIAGETEPTINTVESPLMYADMVAQITEQSNVQADSSVYFTAGSEGAVKIKVGVPESGFYNVAALLKADGTANLDSDLILTTYRGERFAYDRTTRGDNWTYAPANVYLDKGDRILTFSSDMTGSKNIVMSGVRLYNIKTAFVATGNVAYEITDASKGVTVTAGDMFVPNIGVNDINSVKVVLEVREAKAVRNQEDWTKTAVTFTKAGEYTVSISDDVFCNVVKTKITVTQAIETEPTLDTVAEPLMYADMIAQITGKSNVQSDTTTVNFIAGSSGSVKIKVGVPVSGYYNVSALLKAGDGTANLDNDLILTTDRGDSFTYSRTTRGGSWTYAPENVYLVKGDRILTFSSDMTGSKNIVMNGVRLYHMTKAFYALGNVAYEIPGDAESVTVNANELFATEVGVAVNSSEVTIEVSGATVVKNSSDWTKSTITFPAAGTYTISINDKFYGGVTTVTVTVTKASATGEVESEPTVASQLVNEDMLAQVTSLSGVTKGVASVNFTVGQVGTAKIRIGVPATGYYKVEASGNGILSGLTVTTSGGDSSAFISNNNSYWDNITSDTVYLVKGDRILTFSGNITLSGESTALLYSVRLIAAQ